MPSPNAQPLAMPMKIRAESENANFDTSFMVVTALLIFPFIAQPLGVRLRRCGGRLRDKKTPKARCFSEVSEICLQRLSQLGGFQGNAVSRGVREGLISQPKYKRLLIDEREF
jgi:hypothetical protein